MKVILTQNVKGLGKIGDIKNVSDGYGRNLLIPRNMAKVATDAAAKEVEAMRSKAEAHAEIQEKEAGEIAEKLKDATLTIPKKASPNGRIFASVSKDEIVTELNNIGIHIHKSTLSLGEHGEHIKLLGDHTISYEPTDNIKQEFTVSVVSE